MAVSMGHEMSSGGTQGNRLKRDETASDAVLAGLYEQPFRVVRPAHQACPFVFASPHSGRTYPLSFIARSRLSALNLRRSEDAFIDHLFAGAIGLGAPFLAAEFPRAFVDANRAPTELDGAMFHGALPLATDSASPRVSAGLGVIPRIVRDGAEIYRDKLPPHEAEQRLSGLHQPYHSELSRLLDETYARFGASVVIDCHSMPSAAAAPDVVIGDRYGTSASPSLTRRAERAFEMQGFMTARNVPYAGGYTAHLYGQPAQGRHALQIEINRALYLDEDRILPIARFQEIAGRIAGALQELVAIEPALLGASPSRFTRIAAE